MKPLTWILDLLFPHKCPFCKKIVEEYPDTCEDCWENLPWTSGEEISFQVRESISCLAPLWYRGEVPDAVKRYKFHGAKYNHQCFGELMAEVVEHPEQYDVISWVPLAAKRFRSRGYNQAELLALVVAEETEIRPLPLLEKWKDNQAQAEIEDDDLRGENTKDVYRLCDSEVDVKNLRILLVDDVITTGNTVSSCINVLKDAGAKEVTCLSLARSRRE